MASEENPAVKAALSILPLYGVECWRNNAIRVPGRAFNGRKGVGDVLGITRQGLFVSVELKKPDGVESPEQAAFREMVSSRGGVALCAYGVADLEKQIREAYRKGLLN